MRRLRRLTVKFKNNAYSFHIISLTICYLFYSTLPSIIIGATRRSRAEAEARLAAQAAAGVEVIDYGPGEKEKTPRHKDAQGKIDEMFDTMGKDANALSDAMKSIAASVAAPSANVPESPTKKKLRNYKELTESIRALIQERKDLVGAGLATDDVDDQLKLLQKERSMLNQARASGTNLGSAFNNAAWRFASKTWGLFCIAWPVWLKL